MTTYPPCRLVVLRDYLIAAAICCSVSEASAALVRLDATPYDRQLARVADVLRDAATASEEAPGDVELINRFMSEAYRIPYADFKEWQSPEETIKNKRADCKGRAVLLHSRLNAAGIGGHRLVIGRVKERNRETHTWLVWKNGDTEYLLDPTFNKKAIPIARVAPDQYVPEFIYLGGAKYGYVANAFILDGLEKLPEAIRERSEKNRVFIVEEESGPAPDQNNNLPSSAPLNAPQNPVNGTDGPLMVSPASEDQPVTQPSPVPPVNVTDGIVPSGKKRGPETPVSSAEPGAKDEQNKAKVEEASSVRAHDPDMAGQSAPTKSSSGV